MSNSTKMKILAAAFGVLVTIPARAGDFPRFEVFWGFSLIRPSVPGNLGKNPSSSAFLQSAGESVLGNVPGWGAGATLNLSRVFGITADFGGQYKHADTIEGLKVNANGDLYTFLFGPTLTVRKKRLSPFIHALFGVGRVGASNIGSKFAYGETGLAASVGGGLDIAVRNHVAIRAIDVDYFPYRHSGATSSVFDNIRWRAGIVIR